MEDVIAHIAEHPLDQTRPLWQFWVLEGLEDGSIALVQKIHHTLADGMASVNFLMRLWQSGYHDPDAVAPPWQPEPLPGKGRLLWDALLDHVRHDIGNLPSFLKAIYRGSFALKKVADPATSPTLKSLNGDIPQTPWNRALSSRRSFAMAQLDLEELKSLKTALSGTLNDVVLAVTAGSLRGRRRGIRQRRSERRRPLPAHQRCEVAGFRCLPGPRCSPRLRKGPRSGRTP